ncbi:MAG: hypothetical protein PHY80_04940 [Rickettsiales bacterium]|nr:hypothetical protein [Rickettsiales bacterium]
MMAEKRGQEDYLEVQNQKLYDFMRIHELRELSMQQEVSNRILSPFIIQINQTLEEERHIPIEEFENILNILLEKKDMIVVPPVLFRLLSRVNYIDFIILEQFLQFKTEETIEGDLSRKHLTEHINLHTKNRLIQNF